MNKSYDFMMRTFPLKKDTILASLVMELLLILIVLASSDISHQTQNIEATNITQITNSSSISELIQKARTMLNSSKYEEALVTFDQALKIDSRSVDALNGKGLIFNQLGKYEEAINWFDKALSIDPNFVNALNNKGVTLANLGKYEEAINWFDKALSIDPNFVDALYNKGGALGELGRYEEAIVWTDKALALEPANQNDSNPILLLPNE